MLDYYYETDYPHYDNHETLHEYLTDHYDGERFYSTGVNEAFVYFDGVEYTASAYGRGDSYTHGIKFTLMEG